MTETTEEGGAMLRERYEMIVKTTVFWHRFCF